MNPGLRGPGRSALLSDAHAFQLHIQVLRGVSRQMLSVKLAAERC